MARKNLAEPFKILTAQSLAVSFFTSPMNVDYLDNIGIIADCTGVTDNTGTFAVQVRFKDKDTGAVSNWGDLTMDTVPTLASTSAVIVINLNQIPFSEFRLAFTAAGAVPDGIATVWFSARQVGG